MQFEVGDLIHYRLGTDFQRYMLVTGHDTKQVRWAIGPCKIYKLLDLRTNTHLEWDERWVDNEFMLVQ